MSLSGVEGIENMVVAAIRQTYFEDGDEEGKIERWF